MYEDERTVAFAPLDPATRGHTLVIPKAHAARLWDLSSEDASALMATSVSVSATLRRTLDPDGLNLVQSNGAAATQTIDHVHVHLVPRWRRDRMTLRWPRAAAESRDAQRHTADLLRDQFRSVPSVATPSITPEDRRQHLGFVQSVISRMANASASAKTWLMPLVTVTYGYAFVERSWPVAALGILAVVVFALLDANYLKQERAFRRHYDRVASGEDLPAFSMDPTVPGPAGSTRADYLPNRKDWTSWAIAPFYGPIALAGVLVLAYIGWSCPSP